MLILAGSVVLWIVGAGLRERPADRVRGLAAAARGEAFA
jgi:hypothetical protein